MPMRYSLKTSIVSCGSQSPVSLKAFSPARTSFQEMVFPYFAGRRVENQLGGRPDVDAGAVAFDERDDGLVGNGQSAVLGHGDLVGHDDQPTGVPHGAGVRRGPASGRRRSVIPGVGPGPHAIMPCMGQGLRHGRRLIGRDIERAGGPDRRSGGATACSWPARPAWARRSWPGPWSNGLETDGTHDVQWLMAAAAGPAIPFAAFAPHVPEVGGDFRVDRDGFDLLQSLRRAVIARAGGKTCYWWWTTPTASTRRRPPSCSSWSPPGARPPS